MLRRRTVSMGAARGWNAILPPWRRRSPAPRPWANRGAGDCVGLRPAPVRPICPRPDARSTDQFRKSHLDVTGDHAFMADAIARYAAPSLFRKAHRTGPSLIWRAPPAPGPTSRPAGDCDHHNGRLRGHDDRGQIADHIGWRPSLPHERRCRECLASTTNEFRRALICSRTIFDEHRLLDPGQTRNRIAEQVNLYIQ